MDSFGHSNCTEEVVAHAIALANLLLDNNAKCNLRAKDKKGRSPLHYAASLGDEGFVRRLIGLGADVAATDKDGCTPLVIALRGGCCCDAVVPLLTTDVTLHAANNEGRLPLFLASTVASLKYLLDFGRAHSGPDFVHSRNSDGKTRLMSSAKSIKLATVLLDNGASVNDVDKSGNNMLHHAVRRSDNYESWYPSDDDEPTEQQINALLDPVKALLDGYGADLFHQNHAGKRPSAVAESSIVQQYLLLQEVQRSVRPESFKRCREEDKYVQAASKEQRLGVVESDDDDDEDEGDEDD